MRRRAEVYQPRASARPALACSHLRIPSETRSIEPELERVRAALRELSLEVDDSIRPLLEQGGLERGKLLRPRLLLLSGGVFGNRAEGYTRGSVEATRPRVYAFTPDASRPCIEAAVLLELIHTATLLHDDVLDRGQVRRGSPTANRRWGNRAAVRLGDILLGKVLERSTCLAPDVRVALGRMVCRTCAGEICQTAQAGNLDLTEPQYLAIISRKTAALFRGACRLGARLSGAPAGAGRAAARFGYHVGMAYQIMDDLLDIVADAQVSRKTLGTDLRSSKLTLPLIHALRALDTSRAQSVRQALVVRSLTRSDLLETLAVSGSVPYVVSRIMDHANRAAGMVSGSAPTPMRAALLEIPATIVREAIGQAERSSGACAADPRPVDTGTRLLRQDV